MSWRRVFFWFEVFKVFFAVFNLFFIAPVNPELSIVLSLVSYITSLAVAFAFAGAVAFAVAVAGAFAFTGAVAFAGVFAFAGAFAFTGAVAGAFVVAGAGEDEVEEPRNSRLNEIAEQLKSISKELKEAKRNG